MKDGAASVIRTRDLTLTKVRSTTGLWQHLAFNTLASLFMQVYGKYEQPCDP